MEIKPYLIPEIEQGAGLGADCFLLLDSSKENTCTCRLVTFTWLMYITQRYMGAGSFVTGRHVELCHFLGILIKDVVEIVGL